MFKESIQVSAKHYKSKSYLSTGRFLSFREQVDCVLNLNDVKTVFEIGKGNGVVEVLLKNFEFDVKTIDFDAALNPDIVCSVLALNTINEKRDVVICCEVLEHLPYECFLEALDNLKLLSNRYILLSLPFVGYTVKLNLLLAKEGNREFTLMNRLPLFWENHIFDGQHYWEVGKKGYSYGKIKKDIETKLKVISSWFHPYNKSQVFFLCEI